MKEAKSQKLIVVMDTGKEYCFYNREFDEYEVRSNDFIIKKGNQWIGCFRLNHLIGFYIDYSTDSEN